MTEHPDTITVAKCHPFRGDNFYITLPGSDRSGVEYIRADVARAERDAAVALAMQRAAKVAGSFSTSQHVAHSIREGVFPEQTDIRCAIEDEILALAPADALAEVGRLRVERDRYLRHLTAGAKAINAAEDREAKLREALEGMIAVAENEGWDKTKTGRQIVLRLARAALQETKP